jgi:predicted  nucleic acid-binding Zn-ribbon protein
VASLEERVSIVETHSDALARAMDGVRSDTAALRSEIAAVRSEMATRGELAALRTEMADLRRDMMAGDAALRSEIAELRGEMGRRFDVMDQKFMWLAGTQVATLLAVVGVLAGALYR